MVRPEKRVARQTIMLSRRIAEWIVRGDGEKRSGRERKRKRLATQPTHICLAAALHAPATPRSPQPTATRAQSKADESKSKLYLQIDDEWGKGQRVDSTLVGPLRSLRSLRSCVHRIDDI